MAILDLYRDEGRDRDRDGYLPHQPDCQTPAPIVPEEKPYHAKRPHRKSRLGCRNCKLRRVKCDEAKPSCRKCALRKEPCTYPSPSQLLPHRSGPASASAPAPSSAVAVTVAVAAPASAPAAFPSPSGPYAVDPAPVSIPPSSSSPLSIRTAFSPAASYTSPILAEALSPVMSSGPSRASDNDASNSHGSNDLIIVDGPAPKFQGVDAYDMRLLWFYTTETYATFSVEAGRVPQVDRLLRSRIVELAFESPFLMDCILGLSALHMQSLQPTVSVPKAIAYRARAFSGYRKAVQRAQPREYPAVLACSLLLCFLSSELFRDPDMKPLYVIDWMVVWRGVGLVKDIVPTESLFSSGLDKLFARPTFDLNKSALYIPGNLLFMITSIKEGDTDYPHVDAYYSALKFLGSLYLELENGFSPVLSLRTITFFTFLPTSFIQLAKKRRPKALIIIAYYLAFLKMIEDVWWLAGIADRGLQDIIDHVGPEWQSLMQVPRAVTRMYDRVELAKLLKGNHAWEPAEVDQQVPNLTMVNNVGEEVEYDKQKGWVPLAKTPVPEDSTSNSYQTLLPPET